MVAVFGGSQGGKERRILSTDLAPYLVSSKFHFIEEKQQAGCSDADAKVG